MDLKKIVTARISTTMIALAIYLFVALFVFDVHADSEASAPLLESSSAKPQSIAEVGIDEKLGSNLDLNLEFRDEDGKTVKLSQFYNSKLPVIISPVYFSCPGLCNFHLNGLTDGLKEMDWLTGEKFHVLAVSFDPKEESALAKKKKESYLEVYGRKNAENGWHFLTGDEANVRALMASVGFKYKWDKKENQWAHASAAIITSPQGKITRYLPGIVFEAKDIKLALNEATEGKVGTFIDSLVLYCFKYDPKMSKYTFYAHNLMKAGGGVMVFFLAMWLLPIWIRKKKNGASA